MCSGVPRWACLTARTAGGCKDGSLNYQHDNIGAPLEMVAAALAQEEKEITDMEQTFKSSLATVPNFFVFALRMSKTHGRFRAIFL